MKNKHCHGYCGVTCVNGNCPNALSNADAARDDDALACYHLDKPIRCDECIYNNGCEYCAFAETEYCVKGEEK